MAMLVTTEFGRKLGQASTMRKPTEELHPRWLRGEEYVAMLVTML